MTRIRLADPGAVAARWRAEALAGMAKIAESGAFVGGPAVAEAERLAATILGRRGAVGVASGTDALAIALQAAGLRPGELVVVPALTFFATVGAVHLAGGVPYVVDVDDRGLLDPDEAAKAFEEGARFAVPVHLFGNRVATLPGGATLVHDLAQMAGAPPFADVAIGGLSAYPTKVWPAPGDGGFVVGDDLDALQRARHLGSHGHVGSHHHHRVGDHIGRNSRLDALAAAWLTAAADHLPDLVRRRQAIAATYDAALAPSLGTLVRDVGNPVPVYVVLAQGRFERDRLAAHLDACGVDVGPLYPMPLHAQPALAGRCRASATPRAEALCPRWLAVPCHPGLRDDEVGRVADALSSFPRPR